MIKSYYCWKKVYYKNRTKVLIFFVSFIMFVVNIGCVDMFEQCEDVVVGQTISPNKNFKAIIFQRNCGATNGFNTQISILKTTNNLPNEDGHIFSCDDDHGKTPNFNGTVPVLVEWKDDHTLLITHDSRARIFLSSVSYQGISVLYFSKTF